MSLLARIANLARGLVRAATRVDSEEGVDPAVAKEIEEAERRQRSGRAVEHSDSADSPANAQSRSTKRM